LIYFTFRDDTYGVSSVFTSLVTIGGFAAGVRILLERTVKTPCFGRSGNSRRIPENYISPED
jgi:hypothetical protein